jgi:hypothetical protein
VSGSLAKAPARLSPQALISTRSAADLADELRQGGPRLESNSTSAILIF